MYRRIRNSEGTTNIALHQAVLSTCDLCRITVVSVILALPACAIIDRYVVGSADSIEQVPTDSGRIERAGIWITPRGKVSLRGEVLPIPLTKGSIRGHVDIEIISPDGRAVLCETTRQGFGFRRVRKPFSLHLEEIPEPGSRIRIWHHQADDHDDCADPPELTRD